MQRSRRRLHRNTEQPGQAGRAGEDDASWAHFNGAADGSGAVAERGVAVPSILQVVTFVLNPGYGFRAVQP